jgi:TolA-binding protein
MAKKTKKAQEDLLENPEQIVEKIDKAEVFIEKNQKLVTYIGGAIGVLVVLGFFGYSYFGDMNKEASNEMFPAQFYFEKDSFDLALDGDGANLGFLDITKEYSYTDAGNLANFYAGVCYMQKGEFDNAIEYLGAFNSDDLVLQARAYTLIGDAHMEQEKPAEAIKAYKNAVNFKPNKSFTPGYMMKLALAYEVVGNWQSAADTYNTIIKSYPTFAEIQDAKRFKARAEMESKRS